MDWRVLCHYKSWTNFSGTPTERLYCVNWLQTWSRICLFKCILLKKEKKKKNEDQIRVDHMLQRLWFRIHATTRTSARLRCSPPSQLERNLHIFNTVFRNNTPPGRICTHFVLIQRVDSDEWLHKGFCSAKTQTSRWKKRLLPPY